MTENIVTEKLCRRCGQTKPVDSFAKASKRPDGLQCYCRACYKADAHARNSAKAPPADPSLPGEEWRAIPEYSGLYEASNQGRIRRVGRAGGARAGHIIKPWSNRQGYATVSLWMNNCGKRRLVHRLVAAAFIGPCPKGEVVNHLNSDPRNNRPENLEYTTQAGNVRHASEFGRTRKGSRHQCAKLTEADVLDMRRLYAAGGISIQALADRFGVTFHPAYNAIKGKQWKHV